MSAIRVSSMSMMLVTGARRAAIRGQAASTRTASKLGQNRPCTSVRPQKYWIARGQSSGSFHAMAVIRGAESSHNSPTTYRRPERLS